MKFLYGLAFIIVFSLSCSSFEEKMDMNYRGDAASKTDENKEEGRDKTSFVINEIEESKSPFIMRDTEDDIAPRGSSKNKINKNSNSGLKAGYADDNKQFNYYLNFLKKYKVENSFSVDISKRIIFNIKDKEEASLFKTYIEIFSGNKVIESGYSGTDGTYLFFPSEYPSKKEFHVRFSYNQKQKNINLDINAKQEIDIIFDLKRRNLKEIPLDIVFILDTTGSMGEEIERLKRTIEIINLNLISLASKPSVRFGMVLYKDRGDEEYITRIIPLTSNIEEFRSELDQVSASGGGDLPEDLQAAMEDAIKKIHWHQEGINLAFIITDAPPHLDYEQGYTYIDAIKDSKEKGIKIFTVGTGELDLDGEYILRQISQYTKAKYIFLTYGEKGESEGGSLASVSHHTGANYQTDKLESIIIRFAKEELSYLQDQPLSTEEEYFKAIKLDSEEKSETLIKLFEMAIGQLSDYASMNIKDTFNFSLLPIFTLENKEIPQAEYFYENLIIAFKKLDKYKLVERKNIQKILNELELQLSGLVNENTAVKIGQFEGADIVITGHLFKKINHYEIIFKLVRVETAEILSATLVRIDFDLGL